MPRATPDLQYTRDGNRIFVHNPHTGRYHRLPIQDALLLQSLDGQSYPGECAGMDDLPDDQIFRILKKFHAADLLADKLLCPTIWRDPGTFLFMFPCPQFLRPGRLVPALCHTLLLLLWLPLLVISAAIVVVLGGWDCLPLLRDRTPLIPFAALAISAAVHELSHTAAASRCGVPADGFGLGIYHFFPAAVTSLSLLPFADNEIFLEVTLAGPLSNIVFGSITLLPAVATQSSNLLYISVTSYLLAAVNLLPFPNTDGQILHGWFPRQNNKNRAGTIALSALALAAGFVFRSLPFWLTLLLAYLLSTLSLLIPACSISLAEIISTFVLLPQTINFFVFPAFSTPASLITNLPLLLFCLAAALLSGPILEELIFATIYLVLQTHRKRSNAL